MTTLTTLADLNALQLYGTTTDAVYCRGRNAAGDEYEGIFEWKSGNQSANISADTQHGVWVPPSSDTTGASGAWKRQFDEVNYDARWFGVISKSSDSSTAINAAMKYADYAGGGVVQLPVAKMFDTDWNIGVTAPIDNKYTNVLLRGATWQQHVQSGYRTACTIAPITGYSGSYVLRHRTDYSGGKVKKNIGGGFVGITAYGNSLDSGLMQVDTIDGGAYQVYLLNSSGNTVCQFVCGQSDIDVYGPADVQNFHANIQIDQLFGNTSANCLVLDGSSKGDTSLGFLDVSVLFNNGKAVWAKNTDHVTFNKLAVTRASGGTGYAYYGSAGVSSAGLSGSTATRFLEAHGNAPFYLEGTEVAGTDLPATVILDQKSTDGFPAPAHIGTGCRYICEDDVGVNYGKTFVPTVFAADETLAHAFRNRFSGTETIRVVGQLYGGLNLAQTADGLTISGEWSVGTQATSGDLLVNRIAGSGKVNLGNGANVEADGNVTVGALVLSPTDKNRIYNAGGSNIAFALATSGTDTAYCGFKTISGAPYFDTAMAATGVSVGGAPVLSVDAKSFGYATGKGGAVTQTTSKSTGVTLNASCGQITLNNAALGPGAYVFFTLTNNKINAGDMVLIQHYSDGALGAYGFAVTTAAGSASITIRNLTNGSLSDAIVIQFAVIKCPTS